MSFKVLSDKMLWVILLVLGFFILYQKGLILANFESIDPHQAKVFLSEDNATLLDVRTPEEFRESHIQGAKLIPMSALHKRLDEIDKTSRIIVYCETGNRSVSASRLLSNHGFTAFNVKGGIDAWKRKK
ncbi:MAG: rhodanese-like domain-containing protein [Campylobacterota bacterium]|nr:rhodanese-like domain-containing protein [Campylobacterota bacterium]